MDFQQNKKRKQILLIFVFIAFYSLSLGMWEEYKSLWLEANGFSVSNLSLILSGGIFLTAIISIFISFIFKGIHPKDIIVSCIMIKLVSMVVLIFLFQKPVSETLLFIIFIVDTIAGQLIRFSIYPLLTQTARSNKLYGKSSLLDYLMSDIGLAVAMIIIYIMAANVLEYNVILIVACLCTIVSAIISVFFKRTSVKKENVSIKRIFKDKIILVYVWCYGFFGEIAYYSILGMKALLLKNLGGMPMTQVSVFILIGFVCGDIFGYFALWKLTPKNDYVTFCLKFVTRLVVYALVAITANPYVLFVAIFVSLFVSRAFENVTDGPYVNRVRKEEQFAFSNYRKAVSSLGRSIGLILGGFLFNYGLHTLFGVGCAFLVLQIASGIVLVYMRKKDRVNTIIYSILRD